MVFRARNSVSWALALSVVHLEHTNAASHASLLQQVVQANLNGKGSV